MTSDKRSFLEENAPCYLYDEQQIVARCRELRSAVPQAQFLYSIKANPFPPVVGVMAGQNFGADAASANEVLLAAEAGIPSDRIYYSSPGKTERDFEKTEGKCVLIADSLSELERLEQFCAVRDLSIPVGVRVNPDFSMDGSSASPSKFGIDMETLEKADLRYRHLKVTGIHVHLRSQVLDTDTLCRYYENCFSLAERVNRMPGTEISFLNFGSGIGTVYDASREKPLMLHKISETLRNLNEKYDFAKRVKLLIETGRYLVCSAGRYYTKVIERKISGGKVYLIVQNGMNGFFRPVIAELLQRNLGNFPVTGQEPLYTSGTQCSFHLLGRKGNEEIADVVGNLCTSLDVLASGITLPHGEPGDILEITNAGSYGCTLTPVGFSYQDPPKEFLWKE